MAAAVARVADIEKTTSAPERKRTARVRTRRRMKTRVSMLSTVMLFCVGLALPFAYTNVYANLAKAGYSRSDYESKVWKERIDNQRLKLQIDSYSSYNRVKTGAVNMGMVPATDYDYIGRRQTVASR